MAKRVIGQNQQAFKNVGKALRKEGVQFRMNVMEWCRGCISSEKLGLKNEDQLYGFTYGGQGQRITWNEQDEMVYASSMNRKRSFYYRDNGGKVDSVYVNHGNGSAEKIAQAFRDGGFEVEWDGNEYSCVVINID